MDKEPTMNFKQFRSPANDHARMRNGRGGRGLRLQSKLGTSISLSRLEYLLFLAERETTKTERKGDI
jgi:hypothetical protein